MSNARYSIETLQTLSNVLPVTAAVRYRMKLTTMNTIAMMSGSPRCAARVADNHLISALICGKRSSQLISGLMRCNAPIVNCSQETARVDGAEHEHE